MSDLEPEVDPSAADDEPLYTDENGVPMLFDVVIPGDYLKAAGIALPHREVAAPVRAPVQTPSVSREDIEARVQAAIDAALPIATERAAAVIRESLLAEVQSAFDNDSRVPSRD